jgi:hypothetical protein
VTAASNIEGPGCSPLALATSRAAATSAFAFQFQITIWLLSRCRGKSSIAEIGAPGRLASFFAVISAVLSNVDFPRFARYADTVQPLRRRDFQTLAGVAVSGLASVWLTLGTQEEEHLGRAGS